MEILGYRCQRKAKMGNYLSSIEKVAELLSNMLGCERETKKLEHTCASQIGKRLGRSQLAPISNYMCLC